LLVLFLLVIVINVKTLVFFYFKSNNMLKYI